MTRGAVKVGRPAPQRSSLKPKSGAARTVGSRRFLALGLALAAVLFAGLGALGPAKGAQATYGWPPAKLPTSAAPTRLWYSPLLLARGVAGEIHATIPCRGLAPALNRAARSTTVLASMRHPISAGGLAIVRTRNRLSFKFGTATFATATLPSGPGDCSPVEFDLDADKWAVHLSSGEIKSGDLGGAAPRVTGLFSGLDLRSGAAPEITVTTKPYGAHASWWQWPAWALAVALLLAALLMAFGDPRPRRLRPRKAAARLRQSLRPVDGVVTLLLLAWWVVGPVLFDDGWVKARQTNGLNAGGFSNYYTTFGANLPLDYWSEWLQQWVVAHTNVLLVLRLPALALLAGTWVVCRGVLARLLRESRSTGAEWALGLAFLLNAFAWGMTLRPEPVVALLLVSVLALALRFAEKPSGWSLAAAGMLVAFAIAAHPAGLIALAPLLAVGPHVGAWARTHGWPAATVVGAAVVAVLGVVLTVGSDAHQRASEGRLIRISGDATASWRDEVTRYLFVGAESTTLRRASVALMLVALASYLGRRRVASPFDVPGASLALALVLLIPTPSKWSWHFGALIGVAALTVAAEVARFRADEKTLRWPVRPLVAYGAIVLVVGWSLFPRADWSSEFGLRTLSWTFAFESRVTLVRLAVDALVVIFVALVLVTLIRRGRLAAWRLPWRLVPLLVPLVVVPLIAWNIAMLVADTVKTPAWTLARQNVESFTGDEGCGLADDTMVAAPASMRPLEPVGGRIDTRAPRWLAGIETPNPLRFALLERKNETRLELPWFRAPTGERIGFYVFSGLQPGDGVAARWGSAGEPGPRAQPWQPTRIPDLDIAYPNIIRWGFVPQGALPSRPPQTDAAQLALASTARPPHAIAATGAVAYRPTTLAALFRLPGARPLVWPNLLLYMPCARLPRLSSGIVEVPTLVVAHSDLVSIDRETAPFHGLIDLYPLRDLGVADSKVEPEGVAVYWVDRRIPGAVLAPASVLGA